MKKGEKMKHAIIGFGTIGRAFAEWLRAHDEEVIANDLDPNKIIEASFPLFREKDGIDEDTDLIWICTAEWNVAKVLSKLAHSKIPVIIRSTIPPETLKKLQHTYDITSIAHVPEFLREATAVDDVFNESRIVVGTNDERLYQKIRSVLGKSGTPIYWVTPNESALIKLISNSWLSTQISFWNDIKRLVDEYEDVDKDVVSGYVTKDPRISEYGSTLSGKPYQGMCLPKDTLALISVFEKKGLDPILLNAVDAVNTVVKQTDRELHKVVIE